MTVESLRIEKMRHTVEGEPMFMLYYGMKRIALPKTMVEKLNHLTWAVLFDDDEGGNHA